MEPMEKIQFAGLVKVWVTPDVIGFNDLALGFGISIGPGHSGGMSDSPSVQMHPSGEFMVIQAANLFNGSK